MAKDPKVDSENLVVHELAVANQEIREQKKAYERQIKGFKGKIASLEGAKHGGSQEAASQTEADPSQAQKEPEKGKPKGPHYVASWQQTCPGCKEPNPSWKDEMICDPDKGGCGRHLGEAKEAVKLEMCPFCSKEKFKQIAGERVKVDSEGKPILDE